MVARRDEVLRDLLELIDRYGWAVRVVGAPDQPEEAAFAYTVGLTAMNHPEIVITGMPAQHAKTFLNDIGASVRSGTRFTHGDLTDEFTSADAPVLFIEVQQTEGLTAVEEVYTRVTALQMVWPDSAGHFPWTPGYRNRPGAQPLLGALPPLV